MFILLSYHSWTLHSVCARGRQEALLAYNNVAKLRNQRITLITKKVIKLTAKFDKQFVLNHIMERALTVGI